MNKSADIIIYWVLAILMITYSAYIRVTCEELGCLAIIIPIIGIFIISGIEFLVSLTMYFKKDDKTRMRMITMIITGIISLFAIISIALGSNN